MSPYLSVGIMFSLGLLQSTVLPRITLLGVHPDLVLLAVAAWSLVRGSEEGMLWALVGGVVMDLFSAAPFGVCTLSLLIVGFAAGLGQANMLRLELLVPIVVIVPATLVYQLSLAGLLSLLTGATGWGTRFGQIIMPSILINSICMPFVYLLARLAHRRTRREEIAW
jgi:rod shape-determining protein MreD